MYKVPSHGNFDVSSIPFISGMIFLSQSVYFYTSVFSLQLWRDAIDKLAERSMELRFVLGMPDKDVTAEVLIEETGNIFQLCPVCMTTLNGME